jgi:hypothetical protein|nr:MAG TPA: hypothetical protein [Caudoviricetes sp.]
MSGIKGYTAEEIARDTKEKLISDYELCVRDLVEIKQHEKAIADIRLDYNSKIIKYRMKSVGRVLDFIRSEYRAGRICDLEILLCHCQNKLNGNIDGTELDLDDHLRGVPFEKVGGSE